MPFDVEVSGAHKRIRRRTIRSRIVTLLALPLAALVVLWAFAAAVSLGPALFNISFADTVKEVSFRIVAVGRALQQERAYATAYLLSQGRTGGRELRAAEALTDRMMLDYHTNSLAFAGRTTNVYDDEAMSSLRGMDQADATIAGLRTQVTAGLITPLEAIDRYDGIFDSGARALTNATLPKDTAAQRQTTGLFNTYWAGDLLFREDVLLSTLPAEGGRMGAAEHTRFVQVSADRRFVAAAARDGASVQVRALVGKIMATPQFMAVQAIEADVAAAPNRAITAGTLRSWRPAFGVVSQQWWTAGLAGAAALSDQVREAGRGSMILLVLMGVVGLLAVGLSSFFSAMFVRRVSQELRDLRSAARSLAGERLPGVVARLRRGEDVDVARHVAPLVAGRTEEIAEVADAFTSVQYTAVEAAAGEARLRDGVSRVMVNLAWRNQALLHRQLKMLDEMERRVVDPDELDRLFRLDHLTTRMRRHAESLVILSGAEPLRGWDEPVDIDGVLRAAVAEVENYTRVEVVLGTEVGLAGPAVADMIHLLAELIENATAFSPPTTEVMVKAQAVGNGLAVEVIDRGVGMDSRDLAEANRRLADPPEFDLADSGRLGLFVVARIAARHAVRVVLEHSPYGGVTAVVLVPTELLVFTGEQRTTPARLLPRPAQEAVAPVRPRLGPVRQEVRPAPEAP